MITQNFSVVFLPNDLTSEAAALIEKHAKKRSSAYIWHQELGKDLVNYLSRPELIQEVYRQMFAPSYGLFIVVMNAELVEQLSETQISDLLKDKQGYQLIGKLQGLLSTEKNSASVSVEPSRLSRLFVKIERVRIPIIVNDKRPYVGDMVGKDEDRGIDPSIELGRAPYSLRFGGSHDGEHWLTNTVGAKVMATPEIKGTVLTYYTIEVGLWAVMILLENTKIVMLIKDLVTLGLQIQEAKRSYPDNQDTKNINETVFTDKFGNPLKKVELKDGDFIGTTSKWITPTAHLYYPGYNREFGTFHFAFLRYEKVQEYRSRIGHKDKTKRAEGVTNDIVANPKDIPLSWFIPALSPESPVKCFK